MGNTSTIFYFGYIVSKPLYRDQVAVDTLVIQKKYATVIIVIIVDTKIDEEWPKYKYAMECLSLNNNCVDCILISKAKSRVFDCLSQVLN